MEQTQLDYFVGLDLGQVQDFTGLAILARWLSDGTTTYAVRHLHRWPPATPYAGIAADVGQLLDSVELDGAALVLDQTGVGRAVVELFHDSSAGPPRRVVLTGGHAVTLGEDGALCVPKKELVATLQVLLQGRRLRVATGLPLADTLSREMAAFRAKVTVAGEAELAWRERNHDDLVLAVALAAWAAERQAGETWYVPGCLTD